MNVNQITSPTEAPMFQDGGIRIVINFLAFQLGWFACVYGAARQLPWLGSLIALAIIAWHVQQARRPWTEAALIGLTGLIGAAWDSWLVFSGGVEYGNGTLIPNTAPYWIVMLWMLFATNLNLSLHWMKKETLLATLLGLIGGPLAYYGGSLMGALSFPNPFLSLTTIALGWALVTPVLASLSKRLDGYHRPSTD